MKQKRKVKSLIPLRSDSSVLATILLFLGGGILLFGALALFTSLGGVASAAGEGNLQYDNGIDDNVEVLLGLEMATGATSANMYFTGNTFYVEENQGISLDELAGGSINGYVNYLGGERDGTNIASDNITIIGGRSVKVLEDNANTTILGGVTNIVNKGDPVGKVAPVMLGGENNIIGENQEGSAIVGGKDNRILDGGQYDFIIGGESNVVNGSNVIVGGGKVNVEGKSNVFVFSYGQTPNPFKPQSENAFYLNLRHGLGLNKDAVNEGIDSYGAVGFGDVDINIFCTNADLGVQGNWQGCLVGCTQASMNSGYRWEMIDHGDRCEGYCNGSDRCMVNPIKIEKPADYTSYCTVGGVDTGNSTQCAPNRLVAYENVIFETYLIDSDAHCPEGEQNKCVFKCDKDFHLRVNTSSSNSNDRNTKKCYADCELPWKSSTGGVIKIKHNDTTGAYNAEVVNCSNDAYLFPESTAIINQPKTNLWTSSQLTTRNGMKRVKQKANANATTYIGKSYESCVKGTNQDYEHYKTLVCYDGTLYIADTNGRKTSKVALGGAGEWYGYNKCEIKEYRCNTGTYNLDRNFILNEAKDTISSWKNDDRVQTSGRRGVYEVCLDRFPASNSNSVCNKGTVANNYHYKLVKCQTHFSKGKDPTVSPYACMESCSLTGSDGKAHWYDHYTTMTGYKNSTELCGEDGKGSCQPHVITCNDGKWVLGDTKYGEETKDYGYNDCTLNKYECAGAFDIKKSDKENREAAYPGSIYDSCTPYSAKNGNKFQCTSDENKYDLVDCDDGYHTEQGTSSRNKYCISNEKSVDCTNKPSYSNYNIGYNKYKWECSYASCWNVGEWVHDYGDCTWKCWNGYHKEGSSCVNNTRTASCTGNPAHSHWVVGTARWEWDGSSWDDPNGRMRQEEFCDWDCDSKYEEVDGACVYVPDGCSSSVCGSMDDGESCTTYERCSNEEVVSTCRDGEWDVTPTSYASPNLSCSSCRGCPGRDHVSHGGKCESYDQCDDEKQTSRCTDGDWDVDPKDYSSPDQGCDNSCPAVGVCPATEDGGECKTYAKCSTVFRTIKCNNGTWSDTPYDYSAPNMGCEPCNTGCPNGPVAHGGRCTSYSTDSSCDCSGVKRVSVCQNGSWGGFDPWEYGSCSAPASCGEGGCSATTYEYGDCSYDIQAMSHGGSDTIETQTDNYDGSVSVSCNNTELSFSNESCSRLVSCGTAPTNAEWVNGYYRKSWNGTSWSPSSKTPTYTSDSSVECSYQCKEHYRWNSMAKQCEPDRRQTNCENLPSNSQWVKSTFAQIWGGGDWTPSSHANICVTSNSSTEECSFICNSPDYECSDTKDACVEVFVATENCVNTTAYACTAGTYTRKYDDDSAYRWDCKDESGCYKCQNGYTDKGEGVCKISCGAGTYLPKNSITCSNCPCGYECPGGEFDKSTTEDQGKNKCASGKYSTAGSSSCDSCSSGNHPNSTQCGCEQDKKCTYQGREYNPGATIYDVYPSSKTCPEICSKTSATCRADGTWDKDINSYCDQQAGQPCDSDYKTSISTNNVASYDSCTDYTVDSYTYTDPYNGTQTYTYCTNSTKYKITACSDGYVLNSRKTECVEPYIGYSITISEYCPTPGDMIYFAQDAQIIANGGYTYYPLGGCGPVGCGLGETDTCYFELPLDALGKPASFRYQRCAQYANNCSRVGWDITIGY